MTPLIGERLDPPALTGAAISFAERSKTAWSESAPETPSSEGLERYAYAAALAAATEDLMSRAHIFGLPWQFCRNSPLDGNDFAAYRAGNAARIGELTAQWTKHLLNPHSGVRANDLSATLKPFMVALMQFGTGAIDLSTLPDEINGVHLAVLLRATYQRRTYLKGWEDALLKAREAMREAGLDESDALAGLI